MEYYSKMFTMGMVGNKIAYKAFENYLKVFVPLVLTAVGLSLAFKMRFLEHRRRGPVHCGGPSWPLWWPLRPARCSPGR